MGNIYTLKNDNGMVVTLSDFGATLVQILFPDNTGTPVDVTLGYDHISDYEKGGGFFGAVVGRVANRIGKAKFTLNGKEYQLVDNDNGNNLHSGPDFMNKRMWKTVAADDKKVTFALHSPDGDQGYPGAVDITLSYELTADNEIKIGYEAVPTADILLNMTNHSFFNLDGHNAGDVLDQKVFIDADAFTPSDETLIPTGEVRSVTDTPMDFRIAKKIGKEIEADYEPLKIAGGYDHNWVLNGSGYRLVGSLESEKTGIKMEVYTDLPGMQLYTGNFITTEPGRDGAVYKKRQGVCFETQFFPDAINKEEFVSPITKAGEEYKTMTTYKFISK